MAVENIQPFWGIVRILCSLSPGHAAFMYLCIYSFVSVEEVFTGSKLDGKVGYRTPPEDVFSKQP